MRFDCYPINRIMAKRWHERFEFYQKALQRLKAGLHNYDNLTELEKDGVIQRFEFTFELAWKTLQDYFAQVSGYVDVKGPRTVLKQAVQDVLIEDGYWWMQMLESRNELTHVYDQAQSRQILDSIAQTYLPLLESLDEALTRKL